MRFEKGMARERLYLMHMSVAGRVGGGKGVRELLGRL